MAYSSNNSSLLFYRLISLWVVIEAFLGGIIHAFSLPISGLLVASGSVICLSLIAVFCNHKNAIIKATIIVVICKALLSPQAPPTAYIAVFFQGIIAQILFVNTKYFIPKCVVLAVLSLVESGLQKIIVLTVLYGSTFFNAVNEFVSKLLHNDNIKNYSIYIALGYLILHLITAIFVGVFIANLPNKIERWKVKYPLLAIEKNSKQNVLQPQKKKSIIQLFIAPITLLALFCVAFYFSKTITSTSIVFQLLFRTIAILTIWFFIVKPLLKFYLNKWIKKHQQKNSLAINEVFNILPSTLQIVKLSWQKSKLQTEENSIKLFAKLVIVNVVYAAD